SRSDLDNAQAAERSTAASVQQAKASVASARINLSYATVTAPIAGRAGQQGVTEGALVGQGTPTLLTTVEQIDPIYVNFEQPAVDIERLRRAQSAGSVSVARGAVSVQLTLADGTRCAHAEALARPEWIVTEGLSDGDRIVVSGTQNARPGAIVAAVPYASQGGSAQAASAAAPAAPGR